MPSNPEISPFLSFFLFNTFFSHLIIGGYFFLQCLICCTFARLVYLPFPSPFSFPIHSTKTSIWLLAFSSRLSPKRALYLRHLPGIYSAFRRRKTTVPFFYLLICSPIFLFLLRHYFLRLLSPGVGFSIFSIFSLVGGWWVTGRVRHRFYHYYAHRFFSSWHILAAEFKFQFLFAFAVFIFFLIFLVYCFYCSHVHGLRCYSLVLAGFLCITTVMVFFLSFLLSPFFFHLSYCDIHSLACIFSYLFFFYWKAHWLKRHHLFS